MAISCISVEFPYDVKSVWEVMTSLDNYAWRSDISKIEVVDLLSIQRTDLQQILQ